MVEDSRLVVGELTTAEAEHQLDLLTTRQADDLFLALAGAGETKKIEALDTAVRVKAFIGPVYVESPADLFDGLVRGPSELDFGKRLFWRYSAALHELICEHPTDDDLQNRVLSALKLNNGGAVAFIALFLASHFKQLNGTEAALIAALLMQIVGKPTGTEVCQTWSSALARNKVNS